MRPRSIAVSTSLLLLLVWSGSASTAKATILYERITLVPPAGQLIQRPTFLVFSRGEPVTQKSLAASDGDLYLEPVFESDIDVSMRPRPVPLNIINRYIVDAYSDGYVAVELGPRDELVPGVKYRLRATPGTVGDFIDMGSEPRTGTSWRVISNADEAVIPSWKSGSPRVIGHETTTRAPRISGMEVLTYVQAEVSDASGILLLGRDASGELLAGSNLFVGRVVPSLRLWLFNGRCIMNNPRWTRLRSIEAIAIGHQGERAASKIISARANPVVASVLAGLYRLHPHRCPKWN